MITVGQYALVMEEVVAPQESNGELQQMLDK